MRTTKDDRLDDISGYLSYLGSTLERNSSPNGRTLFAAALAERWLAACKAEAGRGWDPAALREMLDAVWDHVRGRKIPVLDLERFQHRVAAALPEPGIPGAPKARAVYEIAGLALECCASESNAEPARQAALVAYEAVIEPVSGYPADPKSRKQVWRQPAVQAEIALQQALLMRACIPVIDEPVVEFVKRESRAETIQPESAHFSLAMNLVEPQDLPGFLASALGRLQGRIPAEQLPEVFDSALRPQSGSTAEHLRKLADSADALKDSSPGLEQLSGIFGRLASLWGDPQKNSLAEELASAARNLLEKSITRTEKEHCNALEGTMNGWSPQQRTAYAAALAERWLAAYDSFSEQEGWGDPGSLRRILDAVWSYLRGHPITPRKRATFSKQVIKNAPDTEDFDAPEALAACEILDYALECCGTTENMNDAISAALAACSCYAMMAQGRDYRGDDPEEEERLWQNPTVREEIDRQIALLGEVGKIDHFDEQAVEALRRSVN